MAKVLVYPSFDSLETVKGTYNQRRLRSVCADAQTDLSIRWLHKSYCRFCRALAHISVKRTISSLGGGGGGWGLGGSLGINVVRICEPVI